MPPRKPSVPRSSARRRPSDQKLIDRLKKDLDATNGYLRESEIRARHLETERSQLRGQIDRLMRHGRNQDRRLEAMEEARQEAVVALQAISDLARQAGDHSRKGSHVMVAPHVRTALEQTGQHVSQAMADLGEGMESNYTPERERFE